MGWWRNDAGDQLGDEPADAVMRCLRELTRSDAARPTLGEVLLHLQHVLQHKGRELCAPESVGTFNMLVAAVESRTSGVLTIRPAGSFDRQLRDAIDALCASIADSYETALERRPTRQEILRTFDFVLGYAPDRYLDIDAECSVLEIRAV